MRCAFKSGSSFSGVLGCPGLGEMGVLHSDDDSTELVSCSLSKFRKKQE
uniref:ASL1 fusion protein n=1 Tax=Mus musculus TaxID=10090 RepID=C6EQJ3_MOUSE|nr:ASL1 fusion protein [Mus musculus]